MRIFKRILKFVLKTLVISVFVVVTLDILVLAFFSLYRPKPEKADAAIILGAAINTPALYNRSLVGLKLLQEGKADTLILSGGKISDADISEAEYMRKAIKKNGGAEEPMVLEDRSHTTYENIKNSKAAYPRAKSVIIVSDKFHVARGTLLAIRNGYWPVYWDSPSGSYYQFSEWIYYYIRESVALIDYIPKFLFN